MQTELVKVVTPVLPSKAPDVLSMFAKVVTTLKPSKGFIALFRKQYRPNKVKAATVLFLASLINKEFKKTNTDYLLQNFVGDVTLGNLTLKRVTSKAPTYDNARLRELRAMVNEEIERMKAFPQPGDEIDPNEYEYFLIS